MEAQPFRFSRLGLADGLSQATVYSIAQDSSGFLWVGTQNGVNRYDGHTFHSDWASEVPDEPSPASYGHVQVIYVDRSGTLWVALRGLGLFRFDPVGEAFIPVAHASGERDTTGPQINAIIEWHDSLFMASDAGLLALNHSDPSASLQPRPHATGTGCGVAATALRAVGDVLWTGTADGCVIRERSGGEGTTTRVAPGDAIHSIGVKLDGVVLVATESSGFARLRQDGTVMASGGAAGSAAPTDQGTVVAVTSNGDTWLGTRGGLGWSPAGSSDTTWIGNGTEEEGVLPHQAVYSVFEDATGVIWVGTWAGLARLSPFYSALSFIPRPDVPGIGPGGGIVAMLPDGPDALLTGSLGGLLATVTTKGEATHRAIPGAPEFGADIFSLARERDGTLWVATNGRGIHRRDADGWRAYRAGSDGAGSAPDDRVAAIHVDRAGTVWAGTMLSGLAVYDRDQDRFRTFELSDAALPEPYVWPIREDPGGGLWFAANGPAGGIHYLDPDRVRLDFFDTSGENDEIPNAGRILTLALSGDTVVWFGTQGGGLGRLDRRSRAQRFFTTKHGLPHNSVPGLLEDDQGYVWVSTNDGLARFEPETETFWSFSTASGIQADRFLANAALKSAEGRLYFGGPNGITLIDPAKLVPRSHAPRVALTGFVVRGQERAGLNHEVAREGVTLDPGENFFSIEFAALDFTEPNLNEYRYRLDDFDTDWVTAGSVGSARYTGVPPDQYRFVVQARSSEGVWAERALDVPIRVLPEYHQTLWFRGGAFLLLLSMLGAAYAYRSRQLAEVRTMRLKIASDLHDDIGANLNAIALKSDLLRRRPERVDPARVTQSLSDIQRLANDTMQKVREMIWVVKSEHDTVESLIARMQDVASTMVRGITEIRFSVDSVPKVQIPMDVRQDAYLGFKEAIQNVIRHSGAAEVLVRVDYEAPNLHISVTDDGVGFDPEKVEKGNGLAMLEQRAGRNGTRFAIHSEEERGTTVRITVRTG